MPNILLLKSGKQLTKVQKVADQTIFVEAIIHYSYSHNMSISKTGARKSLLCLQKGCKVL